MLISKKNKFIFVHIFKNAGTSINAALRPFAMSPWQWQIQKKLKEAKVPSPFYDPHPFDPHSKASEIIDLIGQETFDSYFSFAIVRNPWDWQVSLYTYMLKYETHYQHELVKKLGSFEEYIKWRCAEDVRFQKDFIYSESNELLVDYVGRFENLDEDFQQICSRIGVTASLPKLNKSNAKPYQDFYNDKTRELVRDTFSADIELLNYEF
ncbi:sulfotransferase family 2 domain-containing protein [Cerasicoccus frondis]|uniref:sulfotransferase family 2 domain-containing protein n=1 Tax=Cerasicoccus frondis TaxID=490090 RepID=UPI002852722B|nr:sulfotransferase family 2 domain-containing protein [Cerasicoccus frondis]